MVKIIYEDSDILVVEKPSGLEAQSGRGFEPDMVSEIKKYLRLSTKASTKSPRPGGEPYVGVIHRLDKPVGGIMVYAKNRKSAAALSKQVQDGRMRKRYQAVVCGKPVDIVGNFVDYLLKDGKLNRSRIVDKEMPESKCAKLRYRVLRTEPAEEEAAACPSGPVSLLEIELLTGRHHQIRVQFASRGMPLWGDTKYNPQWGGALPDDGMAKAGVKMASAVKRRGDLALASVFLSFEHPVTAERMEFSVKPKGIMFERLGEERK